MVCSDDEDMAKILEMYRIGEEDSEDPAAVKSAAWVLKTIRKLGIELPQDIERWRRENGLEP